MLAKCDTCGKEFEVTGFEVEKVKGDIEKTFFSCTHCGEKYTGFYTNNWIRFNQQKLRDLQKKYNIAWAFRDVSQAQSLFNQIQDLTKRNGEEMQNLRLRFNDPVAHHVKGGEGP